MTSSPPDTRQNPAANGWPNADGDNAPSFIFWGEDLGGKANCIELIVDDDSWLNVIDDFDFAGKAGLLALSQSPRADAIKSPHRLAVIMLSDDKSVQGLNNTYRGKNKPTNILSFPALQPLDGEPESIGNLADPQADDEPTHIGDSILGYATIIKEAERDGIPLKNHISHLIIHGVLHLLGYDHEQPAQATEMEALETKLLQQLNIPDPYDR